MSELKITSNYHEREVVCGFELTEEEKEKFDWATPEEIEEMLFFRYKGNIYSLGEFTRFPSGMFPDYWHGYASDSFFSGILVHFTDDNDFVVVGWYYG